MKKIQDRVVQPLRHLNDPRFKYVPAAKTTPEHLQRLFRKARLLLRLNPHAYDRV